MIVVKLFGGMGNQMFQYAFGYAVSKRLNIELFIDISAYEESKDFSIVTPRQYALGCFNLSTQLWSKSQSHFFFPRPGYISKAYHKILRLLGKEALLYEYNRGFNPKVFNSIKSNTYANGYWQSYLYFESVKERLKEEFKFQSITNSLYESLIRQCIASVSIHIRRGDYASNDLIRSKHGLLSIDYYKRAIEYLIDSCGSNLHFFIFSDDKDWCLINFNFLRNQTIIETQDMPDWYDMYLMSLCTHHIIANSTYSWWGAWLGAKDLSLVVAPTYWYTDVKTESLFITPVDWKLL